MKEFLFSFLVCIGIYLLRVLLSKPKKKRLDSGEKTPRGQASAERLAETAIAAFERKGMENLLLTDFSFQSQLTKDECGSLSLMEKKLQSMMAEVLNYLHLAPISLHVYPAGEHTKTDRLGEFDGTHRTLNFYIKGVYAPEQLAAALCHECTHYFMNIYLFDDWNDRALNERRTDVVACLAGFSKIMIDGYMVISDVEYEVTSWKTTNSRKVGYLNARKCRNVRKILLENRTRLLQKKRSRDEMEDIRMRLKKQISVAEELIEYAENMLAVIRIPDGHKQSKKEMKNTQLAFMALENGDLKLKLKQIKAMQNGTLDQLREAEKNTEEICGTLSRILAAFSG